MDSRILLAGIGGQGVLFIHQLLADCAVATGHNVTGAETHGMSQRGGSVVSHLKIGAATAPLIRQGTADIVLAFNASEAYRNLAFIRRGGAIVVNTSEEFPTVKLRDHLDAQQVTVRTLDADRIARALGRPTAANVALLGFACTGAGFPLPREAVRETLCRSARANTLELNLQAFDEGAKAGG
ncbi:MAG: indolepyruvate oxidoreductase subunit beta [Chloroflexi bacterium]|nr:indolepyruvate oxidoreductase subunit beta [Chloroflexota bacterium]